MTETPDRTRTTKPAIDYSQLTAEDAAPVKGQRSHLLEGTPFVGWLRESYDAFQAGSPKGKAVTVPEAAAKQTTYLIRMAAQEVGCGVRVLVDEPQGGRVRITFQAKAKRAKLTDEQRAQRKAEAEQKRAAKAAKKAQPAKAAPRSK